jgi:UBX domain-containing protein 1
LYYFLLFFLYIYRGGSAPEEESKSQKKPTYYTGSGYRLGSEDEPSTLAQPASPIAPAVEENDEPVNIIYVLTEIPY